jgi:isopentenyl phosphate kinase
MIILKLGGSVITDKTKECTFKNQVMDNLAKDIKRANKKLIIIHGAGSFGHIQAKKYNLNEGYKRKEQLHGFSITHEIVQRLNSLVLKSLHNNDVNAVSIPPHSILKLDNHKPFSINYDIFREYLELGFVPVTFGDVVLDKELSFSICSGDLLSIELAKHFKPDKVIFAIDEDGIYDSNPKINKNAKLLKSINSNLFEKLKTSADDHADVTGGMSGKIETIKNISKLGIDTILLNGNKPNLLYKALIGENIISTIVNGDKR